jgi:hypothetical protein
MVWFEPCILIPLCFLLVFIGQWGSITIATQDTETWNAQLVNKKSVRVSCEHSYQCNCYTDKNGTHCSTCYEHFYDVDWNLYDDMGNTITIDRINRQGTKEPPRWTRAKQGDPIATLHNYTNWVKGVKYSVFSEERGDTSKYDAVVPKYPQRIYDYHYCDRVLRVGKVNIENFPAWSMDLAYALRTMGPKKQANVVLIFTDLPKDFYYSVVKAWNHGKKNDVVIIVGLDTSNEIDWVQVFSWSKKDIFNVKLRDALYDLHTPNRAQFIQTISEITMSDFQRQSMKEFEYLRKEIHLSTPICIFFYILLIGACVGDVLLVEKYNDRY